MKVLKNKVVMESKILMEFLNVVSKGVDGTKFVHFVIRSGKFSMISEGTSARAILELSIDYSGETFSAGVDSEKICAVGKRLYKGSVSLNFKQNYLELKLDNITAKFPVVSSKTTFSMPKLKALDIKVGNWIVKGLVDAANAIEETTKIKNVGKFFGVLFDTDSTASRICKFSTTALYLSKSSPIFAEPFRIVFPDLLAKLAKSFSKNVDKVFISNNLSGFSLTHGTHVLCSMHQDTYPKDYLTPVGLSFGEKLVPGLGYRFSKEPLVNAVDLVSVSLGDSDFWTIFSIVGTDEEGCFVWNIFGKSFTNFEISEKVISSPGNGESVERFGINKKIALKALSIFEGEVFLHNFKSMVVFSDSSGNKVIALTKSVV